MDAFAARVHGIQAWRRRVERDSHALLGALGVAAEPLPHQIANVRRILEAPQIRHLIADGVGLGKTVQTLMIVNVLRQDPQHRTLVVAPFHLIDQWNEEFTTRAHCDPVILREGTSASRDRSVTLVAANLLADRDDLADAYESFDLLVIDEPQSFTVRTRERLARLGAAAPELLILSATPGLGESAMRVWMMGLLEPDRSADAIAADEAEAVEAIAGGADRVEMWTLHAAGRRICRWPRSAWPHLTRQRRVRATAVPTFPRETWLADLAARRLRAGDTSGQGGDAQALAQALHRTGGAARDAVSRMGEREPKFDASLGDSRFDALVDRLLDIWQSDPSAGVVVVAGDNPTIDYLRRRLGQTFADPITREPLAITSLDRDDSAGRDEDAALRMANERIRGFAHGEHQVMLIGRWAQGGLNLHHAARHIVFYSCPWDPRDVDQLIGRVDRLGPGVERRAVERNCPAPPPVEVDVIVWRDAPEARVIAGIEAMKAFEAPRPPVSEERAQEVADALAVLARGDDPAALARLKTYGAAADDDASSNLPSNPHTIDHAKALYADLQKLPPLPGALPAMRPIRTGLCANRENALDAWLEALVATRTLDVRTEKDATSGVRYRTAWYGDAIAPARSVPSAHPIELFERRPDATTLRNSVPRAADGMVAFITHRERMPQPACQTVRGRDDALRRLTFCDYGDPLHDTLLATFAKGLDPSAPLEVLRVAYPYRKMPPPWDVPVLVSITHADTSRRATEGPNDVDGAARKMVRGEAADGRWLRLRRPAILSVHGMAWNAQAETWRPADGTMLTSLLDPRGEGQARGAMVQGSAPLVRAAQETLGTARHAIAQAIAAEMARPVLQDAIAARGAVISCDADRHACQLETKAVAREASAGQDERQRRLVFAQAARMRDEARQCQENAIRRCRRLEANASQPYLRSWTCEFIIIAHPRSDP